MFQSIMDLKKNWHLDVNGRYTDALPTITGTTLNVPSYFTFDVRLARQIKSFEFSCVGQNLWADQHTEAGLSRIPRSIYGKVVWRF